MDDGGAAAGRLDALYEFDRAAVPPDRLLGPGYFAGSFAGEHVAATEFVIGVLFVNWGASVSDVFIGLAIGNLLAVLTWTLLCAPIAVETRLTLYWYLRRIGGPAVSLVYNVLNAVLFCILAGCMITVAASAVRLPFGIPAQTSWYPTDARFVLVVLGVGAVVVTLAVLGFRRLAAFSTVCSPWMFLMFIAGAIAVLPVLAEEAGGGDAGAPRGFLETARRVVWTGMLPPGSGLEEPMGFYKVAAFAWICNLAMHAGLSDMALLRYARHAGYGLLSAFGMFLGHYLAWIAAGLMGAGAALLVRRPLTELDSGAVAWQALGLSGALAVIVAGWTTSNPTLYRAGLAFQAMTPDWPRPLVTVVAGVLTTVIACFPFVFTKLLDFVGIYGLLLAPAGAIVVTEHWLFPRLGLRRYWAARRGLAVNWPALLSWGVAIAAAFLLEGSGTLHLFFLFLPTYALTAVLYAALSAAAAGRAPRPAAHDAPDATAPRPGGETAHAGPRAAAAGETGGAAGRRRALLWASGLLAGAALLACALLALWTQRGRGDDYAGRLEVFRTWLILPTAIYFVAGTLFYGGLRAGRR
jgi:NCS1 family nucleobase:cation symporter-1